MMWSRLRHSRRMAWSVWIVFAMVLPDTWAAVAHAAQAPQTGTPMNMNMDHRGGVSGTVRNGAGAAVAGVTVTATSAATGAKFVATTDGQGAYAFPALPVGSYDLSIDTAGVTIYTQRGVDVAMDRTLEVNIAMNAATASQAADADRQALLEKIATLEQRITDLESNTVLSEPETRVRRVEVFVDASEKIEEALEDASSRSVAVGVDAAMGTQFAGRTRGSLAANRSAYALASADLFFTAGLAQNTVFFADIVGLSGSPPDAEIPTLTLLNGYTARLVRQNELNLREAWLRTELFGQRLALTAGRLDLTNYFDANALANDESTQFISDALVNNQMLGLASNGTGVAAEFDAKTGVRLKFGLQQSKTDAINLSDSMYTLSEVGYTLTPFALPEGSYRAWFRTDNTDAAEIRKGVGISVDQKLTSVVGFFGRYGTQELVFGRDNFYSAGIGFQNGLIFSPQDTWGVGYAQLERESGEGEKLAEGYYNFHLTEKLRLSFHLTHVLDAPVTGDRFGYLLPGVRLQAAF